MPWPTVLIATATFRIHWRIGVPPDLNVSRSSMGDYRDDLDARKRRLKKVRGLVPLSPEYRGEGNQSSHLFQPSPQDVRRACGHFATGYNLSKLSLISVSRKHAPALALFSFCELELLYPS